MKRPLLIGWALLLALAACHRAAEAPEPAEIEDSRSQTPSPALSAIDSLMWQQPDSAFVLLQEFAASPKADSLNTFGGHYFQVLLSELLYKNDYAQTNRFAMQQAVAYFDSLTPALNDDLVFLDARAHYINGVGYYERDSVVEACREYIKALETMEGHFKEKDLVGRKAKFMAYTYNRLGDMFSDQFMMENCILCYNNALFYCRIEPTSPQGVSTLLCLIGQQYDEMGDKESAKMYYGLASEAMPDTTSLSYRDLVSISALNDYQLGLGIEHAIGALKRMLIQAEDQSERLTRFLTIGGIYFEEKQFDSAQKYLEIVFSSSDDSGSKVQAATRLRVIYDNLENGKDKSNECVRFLANNKKTEGENKAIVSKLNDLFKSYSDRQQQRQSLELQEAKRRRTAILILGIAIPLFLFAVFAFLLMTKRNHRQLAEHETKLKLQQAATDKLLQEKDLIFAKERETHQAQKETLQRNIAQREAQLNAIKLRQQQFTSEKDRRRSAFLNESVCRNVIDKVSGLQLSTRSHYSNYPRAWLTKEDVVLLGEAVERHFPELKTRLVALRKKMDWKDMQICYLNLVGLEEAQIAVLLQQNSATIYRRTNNMKTDFGIKATFADFLWELAVN